MIQVGTTGRSAGEIDSRPPFGNARQKLCRFSDSPRSLSNNRSRQGDARRKRGRESISPGCRLALRVVQRAKSTPDPLLATPAGRYAGSRTVFLGLVQEPAAARGCSPRKGSGVDFAMMQFGTTGRSAGEIDSRPPFGNARQKLCRFSDSPRSLSNNRPRQGDARRKRGRESISPGCRLALRVVQRAKSTPDPLLETPAKSCAGSRTVSQRVASGLQSSRMNQAARSARDARPRRLGRAAVGIASWFPPSRSRNRPLDAKIATSRARQELKSRSWRSPLRTIQDKP